MKQFFKTVSIAMMAFAVVLSTGSCSDDGNTDPDDVVTPDEPDTPDNPDEPDEPTVNDITFTASINTRTSGGAFESGDAIYVAASTGATASYSYASSIFSSTSPIQCTEGEAQSYVAVYPATFTSVGSEFTFTALSDQSSSANYESSALLVATADATDAAQPNLDFYNAMSSVELTVSVTGGSASDVSALFYMKTSATINIATETYTESASVVEITPYVSGSTQSVIVAPQELAAGSTLATLTYNGVAYNWVESSTTTFLPGYKYSYSATIDPVAETITIEFTGLINDWETGDVGSGGFDGQVELVLSTTSVSMGDWSGASSVITFTTAAEESTFVLTNNNDWFSTTLSGNATDGYTISIVALEANTDDDSRSGTFTLVVGDEYNGNSATVTVSQDSGELYVGKVYQDENGVMGMIYYMDTTYAYAISVKASIQTWALDATLSAIDTSSAFVQTGDYHAIGAAALLDVEFPKLSDYDGGNGYPAYKWIKEELGANWMLPTRYDWQTGFHECGLSEDEMNAIFLPNGGTSYDAGQGSSDVRYWTCHTNSGGTLARYYNPTTGKASETKSADTEYAVRGVLYIAR